MIQQIKTENIPAVFGSELFPSNVMRTITAESGAAYIDELSDDDLLGGPGDADDSYLVLAVSNLRIMIPALGGDTSALGDIDIPLSSTALPTLSIRNDARSRPDPRCHEHPRGSECRDRSYSNGQA